MKIVLNKPYVYIYKNPLKNNIPFYVGKGKNYRYKHHMSPCILSNDSYKSRIILKIFKNKQVPIIEIIYCETDEEALNLEIILISKFKKSINGGSLTNVLNGGDITPDNTGENHPHFGKSGKFELTNLKTNVSEEVIGIYFWAKQHNLNGTALIEIADKIPIKKPNNKISFRKQHKGWSCKRIF